MKELRTEVEIKSSAKIIWKILMDFDKYPSWNPFIQSISGQSIEGTFLDVSIAPPGKKSMTFRPKVTKVRVGREFRWLGHLGIPGIFDGEHIFELEPLSEQRTKFVQRECFRGMLLPMIWKMLDGNTRKGFEEMNQSLNQHIERG